MLDSYVFFVFASVFFSQVLTKGVGSQTQWLANFGSSSLGLPVPLGGQLPKPGLPILLGGQQPKPGHLTPVNPNFNPSITRDSVRHPPPPPPLPNIGATRPVWAISQPETYRPPLPPMSVLLPPGAIKENPEHRDYIPPPPPISVELPPRAPSMAASGGAGMIKPQVFTVVSERHLQNRRGETVSFEQAIDSIPIHRSLQIRGGGFSPSTESFGPLPPTPPLVDLQNDVRTPLPKTETPTTAAPHLLPEVKPKLIDVQSTTGVVTTQTLEQNTNVVNVHTWAPKTSLGPILSPVKTSIVVEHDRSSTPGLAIQPFPTPSPTVAQQLDHKREPVTNMKPATSTLSINGSYSRLDFPTTPKHDIVMSSDKTTDTVAYKTKMTRGAYQNDSMKTMSGTTAYQSVSFGTVMGRTSSSPIANEGVSNAPRSTSPITVRQTTSPSISRRSPTQVTFTATTDGRSHTVSPFTSDPSPWTNVYPTVSSESMYDDFNRQIGQTLPASKSFSILHTTSTTERITTPNVPPFVTSAVIFDNQLSKETKNTTLARGVLVKTHPTVADTTSVPTPTDFITTIKLSTSAHLETMGEKIASVVSESSQQKKSKPLTLHIEPLVSVAPIGASSTTESVESPIISTTNTTARVAVPDDSTTHFGVGSTPNNDLFQSSTGSNSQGRNGLHVNSLPTTGMKSEQTLINLSSNTVYDNTSADAGTVKSLPRENVQASPRGETVFEIQGAGASQGPPVAAVPNVPTRNIFTTKLGAAVTESTRTSTMDNSDVANIAALLQDLLHGRGGNKAIDQLRAILAGTGRPKPSTQQIQAIISTLRPEQKGMVAGLTEPAHKFVASNEKPKTTVPAPMPMPTQSREWSAPHQPARSHPPAMGPTEQQMPFPQAPRQRVPSPQAPRQPMAPPPSTPSPAQNFPAPQPPTKHFQAPQQPAQRLPVPPSPTQQFQVPPLPAQHLPVPQTPNHQVPNSQMPTQQRPVPRQPAQQGSAPQDPSQQSPAQRQPTKQSGVPRQPTQQGGVPRQPTQQGEFPPQPTQQGGFPRQPTQQGGVPHQPTQQGGFPRKPAQQGGVPSQPTQQGGGQSQPNQRGPVPRQPIQQGGVPRDPTQQGSVPRQPTQQGSVPQPTEQQVLATQPPEQQAPVKQSPSEKPTVPRPTEPAPTAPIVPTAPTATSSIADLMRMMGGMNGRMGGTTMGGDPPEGFGDAAMNPMLMSLMRSMGGGGMGGGGGMNALMGGSGGSGLNALMGGSNGGSGLDALMRGMGGSNGGMNAMASLLGGTSGTGGMGDAGQNALLASLMGGTGMGVTDPLASLFGGGQSSSRNTGTAAGAGSLAGMSDLSSLASLAGLGGMGGSPNLASLMAQMGPMGMGGLGMGLGGGEPGEMPMGGLGMVRRESGMQPTKPASRQQPPAAKPVDPVGPLDVKAEAATKISESAPGNKQMGESAPGNTQMDVVASSTMSDPPMFNSAKPPIHPTMTIEPAPEPKIPKSTGEQTGPIPRPNHLRRPSQKRPTPPRPSASSSGADANTATVPGQNSPVPRPGFPRQSARPSAARGPGMINPRAFLTGDQIADIMGAPGRTLPQDIAAQAFRMRQLGLTQDQIADHLGDVMQARRARMRMAAFAGMAPV
ncbi:hypothetical protein ScPMuIL_003247 [Solemya velum]